MENQNPTLQSNQEISVSNPPRPSESGPEDRKYLFECGTLLLENQDYELARHIYTRLLKEHPNDPVALKGLGISLWGTQLFTLARKCFETLDRVYKTPEALLWQGICLSGEGDNERARAILEPIAENSLLSERDRFERIKSLGNCYTRMGHFEMAHEAYQKSLLFGKDRDVIYVNLGTLSLQLHQYDLARKYFFQAVAIRPSNDKAHCGLGILAQLQNDYQTATAALKTALDINPCNAIAIEQYWAVTKMTKQFEPSLKRFQRFTKSKPSCPNGHYYLADIYWALGRLKDCTLSLREVFLLDPHNPKGLALKELIQAEVNHREETR